MLTHTGAVGALWGYPDMLTSSHVRCLLMPSTADPSLYHKASDLGVPLTSVDNVASTLMRQLKLMGIWNAQIVQRMSATAEGATSLAPLYIYCGHDTTIMPILASLGIQLRDWPPYLSNVVSAPRAVFITKASHVARLTAEVVCYGRP